MASPREQAAQETNLWEKLSAIALTLAMSLVLARGMLLEVIREAFSVTPGQDLVLRAPAAATSVVLDLLCYLPALIVCARAVFDERFKLRWSASVAFLAGLGVLAIASIFWSADRFAAGVSSSRLLAGAVILWSIIQTVRSWASFRMFCGLLVGLLAVNILQGLIYVNMDLPQLQEQWQQTREQIFAQQNIEPGSFRAMQLERKVLGGELMGFNASPNSLAALVVMTVMIVAGGLSLRLGARQYCMMVLPLLLLVGAGWMIWRTDSKTAFLSPIVGVVLMVAGWKLRGLLANWRRAALAGGIVAVLLGWAAVVCHAMYHGTLLHRSLTFRWHYWLGSWQVWLENLWLGVGWENFGLYYLQHRLWIAPEEIRDPHNMFVRFATELGIVGLLLACGWVVSIFCESTAPILSGKPEREERSQGVGQIIWIAALAAVISTIAQTDFRQEGALILEAFRRGVFAFAIIVAGSMFCARDHREMRIDGRPAELLLFAVLAGIAIFLLHNQIDFALFEGGPFFAFLAAVGALIGMRLTLREQAVESSGAGAGLVSGAVVAAGLIGVTVLIAVPVVMGEDSARRADDEVAAGRFVSAANLLEQGYSQSQWLRNSDYLLRKAKAMLWNRERPAQVLSVLKRAAEANPRNISVRLAMADLLLEMDSRTESRVQYMQAVALNPADIGLRLDVARAMERMNARAEALSNYQAALQINARLPEDEPERLTDQQVNEINAKIMALSQDGEGQS